MGLPIAIGSKQVSSKQISFPHYAEGSTTDRTVLRPNTEHRPQPPRTAIAISSDRQLQAVVTVHYYDMVWQEQEYQIREYTVAELHIQMSPLAGPFSTAYRDSVHPITLPLSGQQDDINSSMLYPDSPTIISPSAVFSARGDFLTCLIPHPWSSDTTVVAFSLRRPRRASIETRKRPPVPSYTQTQSEASEPRESLNPVTTNPRLFRYEDGSPLLLVSSISHVLATKNGPPVLVAGCRDGSILALSYRPFVVAGLLYESLENNGRLMIQQMDHLTEEEEDEENDGTVGRLVAIHNNGQATVFRSHIIDSDQLDSEMEDSRTERDELLLAVVSGFYTSVPVKASDDKIFLRLEPTHELEGPFAVARWIAGSYLALLHKPDEKCTTSVYGLYADGRAAPVSTMQMTIDDVVESAHTTYRIDVPESSQPSNESRLSMMIDNSVALEYDAVSDCLAVSSVLVQSDIDNNSSSAGRYPCRFVCLWNWKCNTQGLTIAPSNIKSVQNVSACFSLVSRLHLAKDDRDGRKLVHLIGSVDSSAPRIRKEIYDSSILSPPSDALNMGGRIRRPNALLLSSSSVAYPSRSKSSTREDFEIEWQESGIPTNYLASRGSPVIAAAGRFSGRSIALAASKGICVLDCSCRASAIGRTQTISERKNVSLAKALKQSSAQPKWHLFGSEADEGSFRVLALSWWEGVDIRETGSVDMRHEDVVVAVIEVLVGEDKGRRFLSSWSPRRLNIEHQLLRSRSKSSMRTSSKWGIRLPRAFVPVSLDLLEEPAPLSSGAPRARKAAVLLAGGTGSAGYLAFQLQFIWRDSGESDTSYAERKPYDIFARCSSKGSIGSRSQLLLASASFAFDLETNVQAGQDEMAYVVTVAVVRESGGGLDALALSSDGVLAVGQVIKSVDFGDHDPTGSELSQFWLADIIHGRKFSTGGGQLDFFVWTLQLASGHLLSWSVPFASCPEDCHYLLGPPQVSKSIEELGWLGPVHPCTISLGLVCHTGKTANWMQQSTIGMRKELLLGCIPGSSFGCFLGSAQCSRKFHRSLCDDFERDMFRPDFLDHEILCPCDFALLPPASITSIYALILDTAVSRGLEHELYHMHQHLMGKLHGMPLQCTLIMSLQILVLRLVEKAASIDKMQGSPNNLSLKACQSMFAAIADAVRRHTTPLQFASFFLEIGRQIEPSCLPYLFPLPPPFDDGGEGCERIDDLFDISLEHASITTAVAALPLFAEREITRSLCAAIFRHCLNELDDKIELGSPLDADACREEKEAFGGVFRYAVKFDDMDGDEADDPSIAGSGMNGSTFISMISDENEDEDGAPIGGYSIMCGLSRWFSLRPRLKREEQAIVEAASSFIVHGFDEEKLDQQTATTMSTSANGASLQNHRPWSENGIEEDVAQYLLACVFGTNASSYTPQWTKVAEISALLLDENVTGFQLCSSLHFMDLLRLTNLSTCEALLPATLQKRGGLVKFFSHGISELARQTDSTSASRILDVAMILLNKRRQPQDRNMPGLLFIAIMAGHVSGRISELLNEETYDLPLWTTYLEARFELPILSEGR